MKTLLLSIALMAFMFVSCDKSQAPTQSQAPGPPFSKAEVTKDYPLDYECGSLGCPGCECLCMTGTAHIVTNNNGTHINIQLTAYGVDCSTHDPTGTTYSGTINANITANAAANETINVHSNDGGCDFKLHLTINSNGEITSYHISCD
jgi:hypothetical protein